MRYPISIAGPYPAFSSFHLKDAAGQKKVWTSGKNFSVPECPDIRKSSVFSFSPKRQRSRPVRLIQAGQPRPLQNPPDIGRTEHAELLRSLNRVPGSLCRLNLCIGTRKSGFCDRLFLSVTEQLPPPDSIGKGKLLACKKGFSFGRSSLDDDLSDLSDVQTLRWTKKTLLL